METVTLKGRPNPPTAARRIAEWAILTAPILDTMMDEEKIAHLEKAIIDYRLSEIDIESDVVAERLNRMREMREMIAMAHADGPSIEEDQKWLENLKQEHPEWFENLPDIEA